MALLSAPSRRNSSNRRPAIIATVTAVLACASLAVALAQAPVRAAAPDDVRILGGAPTTFDPAAQGDVGSAAVTAQLFESVTALDPSLTVRPALAESWEILEDGRRIVFHLRPALAFSDGSPLGAEDVVRSWLRVIDPQAPSPLSSLMLDVTGAADYLRGRAGEEAVGLRANGRDVEVDLTGPAADFVAIVAGPTFAVVPAAIDDDPRVLRAGSFVGTGAYVLAAAAPEELRLIANEHYWAGPPPIPTVHLVADIAGRSPVAAFEDGDLDYTGLGEFDASWIRYDPALGPQLRLVPSLSLEYLGFDTTRPPFSDVKVRQAFAAAVDWRRIVQLATPTSASPATGMVPPGVPDRSATDFLPRHDPVAARALLGEAGFPGGRGFPEVTFVAPGSAYASGIVADLERELGIRVASETMDFEAFFARLADDSPAMWTLGWVADYPGPNDFLGILLGSQQSNNYGGWSSPEFDDAIARARATVDHAEAAAAYEEAQEIVRRDAPVVPIAYGDSWALSRVGLQGAGQNGLGILRMAGLAWVDR